MGKIIRRILTIIPAVALQSLWLLLLMKWLTPYAPIIVSLLCIRRQSCDDRNCQSGLPQSLSPL